jgi:hypothetical protein
MLPKVEMTIGIGCCTTAKGAAPLHSIQLECSDFVHKLRFDYPSEPCECTSVKTAVFYANVKTVHITLLGDMVTLEHEDRWAEFAAYVANSYPNARYTVDVEFGASLRHAHNHPFKHYAEWIKTLANLLRRPIDSIAFNPFFCSSNTPHTSPVYILPQLASYTRKLVFGVCASSNGHDVAGLYTAEALTKVATDGFCYMQDWKLQRVVCHGMKPEKLWLFLNHQACEALKDWATRLRLFDIVYGDGKSSRVTPTFHLLTDASTDTIYSTGATIHSAIFTDPGSSIPNRCVASQSAVDSWMAIHTPTRLYIDNECTAFPLTISKWTSLTILQMEIFFRELIPHVVSLPRLLHIEAEEATITDVLSLCTHLHAFPGRVSLTYFECKDIQIYAPGYMAVETVYDFRRQCTEFARPNKYRSRICIIGVQRYELTRCGGWHNNHVEADRFD